MTITRGEVIELLVEAAKEKKLPPWMKGKGEDQKDDDKKDVDKKDAKKESRFKKGKK